MPRIAVIERAESTRDGHPCEVRARERTELPVTGCVAPRGRPECRFFSEHCLQDLRRTLVPTRVPMAVAWNRQSIEASRLTGGKEPGQQVNCRNAGVRRHLEERRPQPLIIGGFRGKGRRNLTQLEGRGQIDPIKARLLRCAIRPGTRARNALRPDTPPWARRRPRSADPTQRQLLRSLRPRPGDASANVARERCRNRRPGSQAGWRR